MALDCYRIWQRLRHAWMYLLLPPTRQDLTQGQKLEGQLKWVQRGGEGRERAKIWTLLVIDPLSAMRVYWVKQYHGPKSRSGHTCQNIARTRPWGLVLYKGYIGVWKAARPSEGGPTKVGGFSASNLPLVSIPHLTRMPDGPAKRPSKYAWTYSQSSWTEQLSCG